MNLKDIAAQADWIADGPLSRSEAIECIDGTVWLPDDQDDQITSFWFERNDALVKAILFPQDGWSLLEPTEPNSEHYDFVKETMINDYTQVEQ